MISSQLCTQIHVQDPTKDWSQKYLKDGTPFPHDKVAKIGWQILKVRIASHEGARYYTDLPLLQAMTSLYPLSYGGVSLCPLEHVHVGNIFVEEDMCMLGGFENKLLGYRPHLYRDIVKLGKLPFIDIIMFGKWVWLSPAADLPLPQVMWCTRWLVGVSCVL